MKRSKIQAEIRHAKKLLQDNNFCLPMFGYWSLEEWRQNRDKLETIRQTLLGWDVTDFGSGDFDRTGAVLFTIRNGVLGKPGIGCPYAEKLIIMRDSQTLPLHFHFNKTEDIINRGGGLLTIKVFNSLPEGEVDENTDVSFYMDGIRHTVRAGTEVEVPRGCSMTITPGLYHLFAARAGLGDVIVGEVSAVNDDNTDNRFAVAMDRFSTVEEDEIVEVPLVNQYEALIFG